MPEIILSQGCVASDVFQGPSLTNKIFTRMMGRVDGMYAFQYVEK